MFGFIKKIFIRLLTATSVFSASSDMKSVSLSSQNFTT